MAKFKVMRHNNDAAGPTKTNQCGAAVKTVKKAYDLMARMRAQQTPGGTNWFTVEQA
ncbi:hypothetical protein GCM10018962_77430 [Dactylosporangium matsuzakiense]|uniref:hypothetical protein n=1 Tax=Dactylosporangium matsuzakiense TaxID=53360 RepID=UPI0031E91523